MPHIVAVGTSIPEFVATNEYVTSLALEESSRCYSGSLAELEAKIRAFLEAAGSRQRRWRAGLTKPLEHIRDAWDNCFAQLDADVQRKLGILIYCGIDRGFAEPSHASILAQRFGLAEVRTFDLADACMGWLTAVEISTAMHNAERPFAAVVSAEFPLEMPGKVHPRAFAIRSAEDLSWKGAALTLGEAAAVTIVDGRVPLRSVHRSNSRLADVCCVPLIKPDRFMDSTRLLPRLADDCFVAHMPTMTLATYREASSVLEEYVNQHGAPDVILPHTVSQTGPSHAAKARLGRDNVQNCFEFFGNIATASIPVGFEYFGCSDAAGAHIAGWISAAGMSHCAFKLS